MREVYIACRGASMGEKVIMLLDQLCQQPLGIDAALLLIKDHCKHKPKEEYYVNLWRGIDGGFLVYFYPVVHMTFHKTKICRLDEIPCH